MSIALKEANETLYWLDILLQTEYINNDEYVFLYDKDCNNHPKLAVKDGDWQEDDPKEFYDYFNKQKDSKGQLIRLVKYLKAWCDFKRQKMPSGFAMSILAMKNFMPNDRDDVALKYLLIEIERELNVNFKCVTPTTPKDDLFANYDHARKQNFLSNLSTFIADSKSSKNAL